MNNRMKLNQWGLECGEDLYLRKISEKDTSDILRWRNSKNVKKYFILQEDLEEKDHKIWLERIKRREVCQFIICKKETGLGIGTVYLQNIDMLHKKAEYGIFIADSADRGKGYGSLIAGIMLQYAFLELGLNRIYLRVLSWNERAVCCYEHAGFQKEGVMRQSVNILGEYQDVLVMGVLREEFQ